MKLSNGQVLVALEQVRLRQVPWQKHPSLFSHLQASGLLESIHQKTTSVQHYPSPRIAVLTDLGKAELERLSRCERDQPWHWEGLLPIAPSPA